MEPPTSPAPTKLQLRTYACKLSARKVKQVLLQLVETSPTFNESWINGEFDVGSRIGGLNQYGDIIVRHLTPARGKHELTIEHRAGDEAMAKEIESAFAKHLTPKAPKTVRGKNRPQGMAYFFEMIRSSSLKKDLIIADSVIENAHDLDFDDYREAREKLGILSMIPRLSILHMNLDARIQRAYKECNKVHARPKFCLHEGQKVALRHRMVVIPSKHDRVMTLHFAKLPGNKILLGWVEEKEFGVA
jgi:hypothetical protein